jgi:L-alanine-DL-glutamate epimerase-like enolase superfamily enzyme
MSNDLAIRSIRHWLIYVPFAKPIAWASGKRPGSTRLVVEVTTEGGVRGYGETICRSRSAARSPRPSACSATSKRPATTTTSARW